MEDKKKDHKDKEKPAPVVLEVPDIKHEVKTKTGEK